LLRQRRRYEGLTNSSHYDLRQRDKTHWSSALWRVKRSFLLINKWRNDVNLLVC